MKKGLIVCSVMLCFMHTSIAQQDSILGSTYVGVLNGIAYNVSTTTPTPSSSLRAGGNLTWKLNNKVAIRSFGVIDISTTQVFTVQGYYLTYKPFKRWEISTGHMATLSTEHRGLPASSNGHFETWTQALIPGATIGVKSKYSISNDITIGTGIAIRKGKVEYHGLFQNKKLKLTGYLSGKQKGMALGYSGEKLYSIVVFNESKLGNTSVITLVPKLSLKYWSDIGIDHTTRKLVRCEGGLLKQFKAKKFDGLFALGYDAKISSITAYLFIYL